MGVMSTIISVAVSHLREVLPLEALPPHLQYGTVVCLETTNTCLAWLQRISVSCFVNTIWSLYCLL